MQGPFPRGTHNGLYPVGHWEGQCSGLIRGEWYRIVRPFVDADGDLHPVGEEWLFIASMFSPHDDELLIAVRKNAGDEWRILLHWTPEHQQDVAEHFSQYVAQKGQKPPA